MKCYRFTNLGGQYLFEPGHCAGPYDMIHLTLQKYEMLSFYKPNGVSYLSKPGHPH